MNEINLNNAECIKSISNIGHTIYRNICDGSSVIVPWGSSDWATALFLIALFVGVIGLFNWLKKYL